LEIKKLHIVALDVPFPADYGGAVDMFYRLKALSELGYSITLHVFEYGRGKQSELEKYAKVIYYKRNRSFLRQFSWRPFIVESRKNKELLANLKKDDAPILLEGIHTCYYLEDQEIQKRLTLVRMHNLEHEYYKGLKKNASFLKKIFFQLESYKLTRYQDILTKAKHILAIKEKDAVILRKLNQAVSVLSASIPEVAGKFSVVGRYALFHGNLSVPENAQAAQWIIETLDSLLDQNFELIIAGKNPGKNLKALCEKSGVKLVANPSEKELDKLIQEAQIHVLYTTVSSGIKLKLLACMQSSGHILLNNKMLGNPAFEEFCVVANSPKDYKIHFIGLQNKVLKKEEFDQRNAFLNTHFNNKTNCSLISNIIEHEKNHLSSNHFIIRLRSFRAD
jgi:hypothetical protein